MDVTIQINDPILEAGEVFSASYQLLPSGPPIGLPALSNAPYTITDLDAGDYILFIRLIKANGEICDAVTRNFTVTDGPPPDTCNCNAVSVFNVQKNCDGTSTINLQFNGLEQGACNWIIDYAGWNLSIGGTLNYSTLPSNISIPLPTSEGIPPSVTVSLQCCNGSNLQCFSGSATTILPANCDCEPPLITDGWINFDESTGDYHLLVNFTSGGVTSAPYTVSYTQIGGTTTNDSGSNVESDYGFFDYVIIPAGTSGDIIYTVRVTNECGFDEANVNIKKCGQIAAYNGGESYPNERTVLISTCEILSGVFTTTSVPAKMIILIGGIEVLNTGYLGSTSYQTPLNAALASMSLPPETITQSVGANAITIPNGALNTMAQVQIFSPLKNTAWSYYINCNDCPPEPSGITLIVENTATSHARTVSVHADFATPASYVTFSPYQPQGMTNVFLNVQNWLGAYNSGTYIEPIDRNSRTYRAESFRNGVLMSTTDYAFAGTSIIHITCPSTGVVAGDEVKIRISSL